MGLFGNSKEKQISNLVDEMKSDHANYEKEAKQVNKSIDLKVRDYNDQIPIINTIRNNDFGPQIDKLYKFLKNFGDVGTEISPFDFVAEKSRVNHHNDMSQFDNCTDNGDNAYTEFGSKVGAGISVAAAFSSTSAVAGISTLGFITAPLSVISPLVIAPLAIGGFMKNKANKDKILQLNKELKESKLLYRNDILARERYHETMGDAIKIAEYIE